MAINTINAISAEGQLNISARGKVGDAYDVLFAQSCRLLVAHKTLCDAMGGDSDKFSNGAAMLVGDHLKVLESALKLLDEALEEI